MASMSATTYSRFLAKGNCPLGAVRKGAGRASGEALA